MKTGITRRTTCRLCGSRDLQLVFQLAPSAIGDAYVGAEQLDRVQERYPIDLFLCGACGLSQLLDVISPEILYADYIYLTTSSLGLGGHFEGYATEVLERIRPPRGSIAVDIGSNDGTLLRFFKARGMRVLGVDPAREIARDATRAGIETLPEFFTPALAEWIRRERGPAAIVTANNVFANVDDLGSMTTGIRALLTPDGVFIFESFYLLDLIRNMVFDFIYHEHISAFAVKPLRGFFPRFGMELIDALRVPTKGGSLRYTVQLEGGPRPVSPFVSELVDLEIASGLYRPETFADFAAKIDALKVQVVGLLRKLKADGKSIAAYGASITGTTLIHHFDLAPFLEFLVDDNPAKQHMFSPGHHIPVYPSQALYERKPDCVVILAWRFVDPIVAKHQTFLDGGGRFVVPVPAVRVM